MKFEDLFPDDEASCWSLDDLRIKNGSANHRSNQAFLDGIFLILEKTGNQSASESAFFLGCRNSKFHMPHYPLVNVYIAIEHGPNYSGFTHSFNGDLPQFSVCLPGRVNPIRSH